MADDEDLNLVGMQSISQSIFIRQYNYKQTPKKKKCNRLPEQAIAQQSWQP